MTTDETHERVAHGIGGVTTDDEQLARTVRVIPIGEGDVTTGSSGKQTHWDRDTLLSAVERGVFDGTDIIKGRGGTDAHYPLEEQVPPEAKLGRVDQWTYEDGVGPVGLAEIADDDIAERIELGILDVSADMIRQLGEADEDGVHAVEEILTVPRVTVLDRGASQSASIEPAEAEVEALGLDPDALAAAEQESPEGDDAGTPDEGVDTSDAEHSDGDADGDETGPSLLGRLREYLRLAKDEPYEKHGTFMVSDQTTDGSYVRVDEAMVPDAGWAVTVHERGMENPSVGPGVGPAIGRSPAHAPGELVCGARVPLDTPLEADADVFVALRYATPDGEAQEFVTDADGTTVVAPVRVTVVPSEVETLGDEPAEPGADATDDTNTMAEESETERLRDELAAAETQVDDLTDEVEGLRDTLDDIPDDWDEQLSAKDERIDDLETQVEPVREMLAEIVTEGSMLDPGTVAEQNELTDLVDMLADEDDDASYTERVREQLAQSIEPRGDAGETNPDADAGLSEEDEARGEQLAESTMTVKDWKRATEADITPREYLQKTHGVDPAQCVDEAHLREQIAANGGEN